MKLPLATARRSSIAGAASSSISSVCSIITTASAPRGMTPPVAIAVAVPGRTSTAGCTPQAMTSALSAKPFRRAVAGAGGVGGAHRKTVDIGAVERRRIDRRDDVGREHARQCRRERQRFAGQAASGRYTPRSGGAPPRRKPLRGIAPAARRGAPHRELPRRICLCCGFMAMDERRLASLLQNLRCLPERQSSRRCAPAL